MLKAKNHKVSLKEINGSFLLLAATICSSDGNKAASIVALLIKFTVSEVSFPIVKATPAGTGRFCPQ